MCSRTVWVLGCGHVIDEPDWKDVTTIYPQATAYGQDPPESFVHCPTCGRKSWDSDWEVTEVPEEETNEDVMARLKKEWDEVQKGGQ